MRGETEGCRVSNRVECCMPNLVLSWHIFLGVLGFMMLTFLVVRVSPPVTVPHWGK